MFVRLFPTVVDQAVRDNQSRRQEIVRLFPACVVCERSAHDMHTFVFCFHRYFLQKLWLLHSRLVTIITLSFFLPGEGIRRRHTDHLTCPRSSQSARANGPSHTSCSLSFPRLPSFPLAVLLFALLRTVRANSRAPPLPAAGCSRSSTGTAAETATPGATAVKTRTRRIDQNRSPPPFRASGGRPFDGGHSRPSNHALVQSDHFKMSVGVDFAGWPGRLMDQDRPGVG